MRRMEQTHLEQTHPGPSLVGRGVVSHEMGDGGDDDPLSNLSAHAYKRVIPSRK